MNLGKLSIFEFLPCLTFSFLGNYLVSGKTRRGCPRSDVDTFSPKLFLSLPFLPSMLQSIRPSSVWRQRNTGLESHYQTSDSECVSVLWVTLISDRLSPWWWNTMVSWRMLTCLSGSWDCLVSLSFLLPFGRGHSQMFPWLRKTFSPYEEILWDRERHFSSWGGGVELGPPH